jgi:hypothetical protein
MISPRRVKQFVDAAVELEREGALTWCGTDIHIDIHHPAYRRRLFPKLGLEYPEERFKREMAEYQDLLPKRKKCFAWFKSLLRKLLGKI